ncbi:GerMN domain-containing protein [Paenibacillus vini]|uniref:GerMN domain-containing protein n=1 Tax=Paenibacillus vini TaxID=1476024 RepID=UPI0025B6EC5D|nr:GerMN domain-containing protein [Paenibacillus vini]MDN4069134.1 GerMN domain-containing protein [Paenibacillus vini]
MKKIGISGMLLIMLIVAAGCGEKPQAAPVGEQSSAATNITDPAETVEAANGGQTVQGAGNGEGSKQEPQEPEKITKKIEVFFTDDDIMELHATERSISFTEDLLKYKEAFKALQTAEPGMISLWEKVILNSVQFAGGELAIDISLPDEARLGSGGEALAIESIKQTFFQFEEVEKLELTVDGEKLDSLMGHVDLEHPIQK